MPLPLKPGYHFHIDRQHKPSNYEMAHLEVYRDYYGISYTVSGNRKYIMPHMIGFLHAGSVGVTPKNVYHKTTYVDDTPYERFVLKFTDEAISPLLEVIGTDVFTELYKYPTYHFSPEVQNQIYNLFCAMLTEYEHYTKESDLLLQGMLHNLIMTVIRKHLPFTPEDLEVSSTDKSILSAMNYMETNMLSNPSLEETARYVSISPSHFSRLFKKATGLSYSEYFNYILIENGRKLLLTTDLSVSEIATLSGFDNGNYFCNVMKRVLGCTPTSLRK